MEQRVGLDGGLRLAARGRVQPVGEDSLADVVETQAAAVVVGRHAVDVVLLQIRHLLRRQLVAVGGNWSISIELPADLPADGSGIIRELAFLRRAGLAGGFLDLFAATRIL